MKKTLYYLLSAFLLCISSMQGLNASLSAENLVDEQIRTAVSSLHPSVQAEALKHTKRLYANQPEELELILNLLAQLKNVESSSQPFVVIHVARVNNASDMEDVVTSWCQINSIENAELRELAITWMKKTKSVEDINNLGNALDTLDRIQNPAIKLEAIKKMLATRSTKRMNKIAEKAADEDDELNEISDN